MDLEHLSISKTGSLRFWGDWFGRPLDNNHIVVSVEYDKSADTLTLGFHGGETCQVLKPQGVVSNSEEFYIRDAGRVVWQWYYYGLQQTEANLRFREYRRTSGSLICTSGYWGYDKQDFDPQGNHAVEIL